jgi:hypothetical protein
MVPNIGNLLVIFARRNQIAESRSVADFITDVALNLLIK